MRTINYSEEKKSFDPWKLAALAFLSYYLVKIAWEFNVGNVAGPAGSFAGMVFYNSSVLPHELGHFIFGRYGTFACVAGGTILELLVPLVFIIYFFFTARFFSAALSVSWLGETVIFVAVYMATAISQEGEYYMPGEGMVSADSYPGLVTDWNYLFNQLGVLRYAPEIAAATYRLGFVIVLLGIALAALNSRKGTDN